MCSPGPAGWFTGGRSESWMRLGRNPARVLPPPVGAISSEWRPSRAFSSISSWCRRGRQPRRPNQSANCGGMASSSPPRAFTTAAALAANANLQDLEGL